MSDLISTESTAFIQFRGLSKRYGNRQLLCDVNLDCYQSQSYLLTGDNGSGKSTLLRIMSGLLKPEAGVVALIGQEVTQEPAGRATQVVQVKGPVLSWSQQQATLRAEVMYMHQSPYLFDGTVTKNLEYALDRASGSNPKKRIQEALQWSELEALAQSSAKQLSGGEKQRVALARAWLRNANLLLLDEPTANLDRSSRLKTIELLRDLKKSGTSLIIACHEYQEFIDISDGVLQLSHGSLQKL